MHFLFFFLILFPLCVHSQTAETIATGRPGQAIGGRVVGVGILQIQSGYDYDVDDVESERIAVQTSNSVVRLGLSETFEISTVVDYSFVKSSYPGYEFSYEGLSQWQLGFRYNIIPPDHDWLPLLGFQTRFLMKQVGSRFKREQVAPIMMFSMQKNLTNLFGLTVNAGMSQNGHNNTPIYPWVISLSQFITSDVTIAYEAWGSEYNDQNSHYWGVGLGWLLNSDFQLDGYVSTGKNHGVDELYVSVGFSWRAWIFSSKP